jgi:hypothetical protein
MTAGLQPEDSLIPMRVTITARYQVDPDAGVYDSTDPAAIAREDLEQAVGAADHWGIVNLTALVAALANCDHTGNLDDVAVTVTPTVPLPIGPDSGPVCAWLSASATAKLLTILQAIANGGDQDSPDLGRSDATQGRRDAAGEHALRALAAEALALLGVGCADAATGRRQP